MKRLLAISMFLVAMASANDVVVVGQTRGPSVSTFDAFNGTFIRSVQPFGSSYSSGLFVASGDVNGDGRDDVIVGAGPGAGPHVRVFDGNSGSQIRAFLAFDTAFRGGVRVGSGDVNGDGYDDIIASSGPGMAGRTRIFSGYNSAMIDDDSSVYAQEFNAWWDFAIGAQTGLIVRGSQSKASVYGLAGLFKADVTPYLNYSGGVFVGSGNVNGTGAPEIFTGNAAGAPPTVNTYAYTGGNTLTFLNAFQPFAPGYTGGVSLSAGDFDGDGDEEYLCGTFNSMSLVYCFDGTTRNIMGQIFQPFGSGYNGGVTVSYGEDVVGNQIILQGTGPFPSIPITVWTTDLRGKDDFTTPFTRLFGPGTAKFTAPQTNGSDVFFENWLVDGVPFGGGQRTITVDTGADHTLVPVFQPGRDLIVESFNPTSGVPITAYVTDEFGNKNGTTPFTRTYTQGTTASVTAPATVGSDKFFMRWNLNYAPWSASRTVSLTMGGADRYLEAVYATGFNANVTSNKPNVPIIVYIRDKNGLTNGTTPFSRLYASGTQASLTAPATAGGDPFKYWIVNGVNQPIGKRTVTFTTDLVIDVSGYFAP